MTKLDTGRTGILPPVVPSKWDVIPIHTSDRAAFKSCRRRWAWSSPSRSNLVPKVTIHGVRMPLWFGTGIHHALERYYNPALKEDPVAVWEEWYNLQWNGGLVSETDLAEDKELQLRDPVPHKNVHTTAKETPVGTVEPGQTIYWVKGLSELLPDPDDEEFEAHRLLGIGMMEYYKTYAEREDNFNVIMVEHQFSIPIYTPDGDIFYAQDTRQDHPGTVSVNAPPMKYSADMKMNYKQVHARGRMDAVIQDKETGQYGIIDHKTASSIDDDYFRHLDLDEQCTTYLWAAEREAAIYDLEYRKVEFVIYQALRKNYPKPPTMTSKGIPSIDRQKEGTTAQLFEQCIKENNLEIVFNGGGGEKMRAYYDYLVEMGDRLFIQRGTPDSPYVTRNQAQKYNAGLRLYYEARDMLNPETAVYPNPTKDYTCLNCVFRAPCLATERGDDWQWMINENYESNYDR